MKGKLAENVQIGICYECQISEKENAVSSLSGSSLYFHLEVMSQLSGYKWKIAYISLQGTSTQNAMITHFLDWLTYKGSLVCLVHYKNKWQFFSHMTSPNTDVYRGHALCGPLVPHVWKGVLCMYGSTLVGITAHPGSPFSKIATHGSWKEKERMAIRSISSGGQN